MDRVDKLALKVFKEYGQAGKCFLMGFVEQTDNGQWEAKADLWDGKKKKNHTSPPERVTSLHDTMDEAVAALEELVREYPPVDYESSPIIINNLTD